MMVLVVGGASSGKSEYAETLLMKLSKGAPKTYLATMESSSDAAKTRIKNHVRRREGRGFDLLEQEKNISSAADVCHKNVLLECLPTLVSNEMFENGPDGFKFHPEVSDRIFEDVMSLNESTDNLVIVSNDVFSDGKVYDEMTEKYISGLGELSCKIAACADAVVYMTAGLPEMIKGEIRC